MSITFDGRSISAEAFPIGSLEDLEAFLESDPFLKNPSPLMGADDFKEHRATPPLNLKKRREATPDESPSPRENKKSRQTIPEELPPPENLGKTAFVYFSVVNDLSPASSKSDRYRYAYTALDKVYPKSYRKMNTFHCALNNFTRRKESKGTLKSYHRYVSSEELEKIKIICGEIIPKTPVVRPDGVEKTAFVYFSVVSDLSPMSSQTEKNKYTQQSLEKIYPQFYPKTSKISSYVTNFINRQKTNRTLKSYNHYVSSEELEKIKTTCREIVPKTCVVRPENLGKTAFIYFSVVSVLSPESSKAEKGMYTYAALEKAYPGFYKRGSISTQILQFIRRKKKHDIDKLYTKYISGEELSKIETLCQEVIPITTTPFLGNAAKIAFIYFSVIKHLSPKSPEITKRSYTYAALEKAYPGCYKRDSISTYVLRFIERQQKKNIHKAYTDYVSGKELSKIEALCREVIPT